MRDDTTTDLTQGLDPREGQIIQAAWSCFEQYGFRKTSMADIAKGAGMSRPAVYQYYRNKDDIFCAMAGLVYHKAEAQIAEALDARGDARVVLTQALQVQGATLIEAMLSSPHAEELTAVAQSVATDIWHAGEARLQKLYSAWLEREAEAGRLHLPASAAQIAEIITWSMKGLKGAGYDVVTYRTRVTTLAQVIADGLRA